MLKNSVIFIVASLILYAVLEIFFFSWAPYFFPEIAIRYLNNDIGVLAQNSKAGAVPVDYIAVMGDSYAEGAGDWGDAEAGKPMARYSSAHLIQDNTQRDVITLGVSGCGSIRAMITEPFIKMGYIKKYLSSIIKDPDIALVYFYEGNDLYDNFAYFKYSYPVLYSGNDIFNEKIFEEYINRYALENYRLWNEVNNTKYVNFLPLFTFAKTLFELKVSGKIPEKQWNPPWQLAESSWFMGGVTPGPGRSVNIVNVDGNAVVLPDNIQGPTVGLSDEELRIAYYSFEQSLRLSMKRFPSTKYVIVYIPSVLNSYQIASETVNVQTFENRAHIHATSDFIATSNSIRINIKEIAKRYGVDVIDTTDDIKAFAAHEIIHGPNDWNHFMKFFQNP